MGVTVKQEVAEEKVELIGLRLVAHSRYFFGNRVYTNEVVYNCTPDQARDLFRLTTDVGGPVFVRETDEVVVVTEVVVPKAKVSLEGQNLKAKPKPPTPAETDSKTTTPAIEVGTADELSELESRLGKSEDSSVIEL